MIFNPYFWLALAAIFSGCYVGGCAQGEHRVNVAWDKDKAVREATIERAAKENADAANAAAAEARTRDASREAAFAALHAQNAALDSRLRATRIDHELLDRMQLAIDAANAKGGNPAAVSTPPSGPSADTSGQALVRWFDSVGELYRACRERVTNILAWLDKTQ